MKRHAFILLVVSLFLHQSVLSSKGQGSFVNLDFEAARLSPIPPDSGGFASVSEAIPGWTAYLGTNQVSQVRHNELATGSASISMLGPFYYPESIIEGSYTTALQAGANSSLTAALPAAIAQTGLVPGDARSLLIKTGLGGWGFTVSIGGLSIPLVEVGVGNGYRQYGGDVSAFAGALHELRITAPSTTAHPLNNVFVDAISFSPHSIPEPNALVLMAVGGALLSRRFKGIQQ